MASPDGTLIDVPVNNLVALRDVAGRQSYPRVAQQIDQFDLPLGDDDLRNWVRQGQEAAAVISSRENLPEYHLPASLQDGCVRPVFSSDRG